MIEQRLQNIGKPVFSVSDVRSLLGISKTYARLLAHRLAKRKAVIPLGGGKYCLPETDAYAVASNLVFPAYVSFLSALRFHGATNQLPQRITVACGRNKKNIDYDGVTIEFTRVAPECMFGYRRFKTGGYWALVAELEKAVVDCAYLPKRGNLSEAFRAVPGCEPEKLKRYGLRTGRGVVVKRVGYMLDKAGHEWSPKGISRKYDLFDPSFPAKGKKDSKWKLLVNRVLE